MENSEIKELLLDLKKGQEELFKGQDKLFKEMDKLSLSVARIEADH